MSQCNWRIGVISAVVAAAATGHAAANIGIEFRPPLSTVSVGNTVSIGVYAVSDSASPQGLSAAQIIFNWQPSMLQMLSNSNTGAASLISSGFPAPDPYGLNELSLPQDGNAIYVGLATFGSPVLATPAGTLLTTLRFTAMAITPLTPISILTSAGSPSGATTVFDGAVPNLPVTGTLTGANVTIIPTPATLLGLGVAGVVAAGRRRR